MTPSRLPPIASLANRIAHEGEDPWELHWQARRDQLAGRDVLLLSVGDPDIETDPRIKERAIGAIRAGDTHYTESSGRPALRAAIARRHQERTGQVVTAANAIALVGAQNSLFAASLLVAGPGDEVIGLDPMYATYPATLQVSGARLVRCVCSAENGFHPAMDALAACITPRTRAIFVTTPSNPTGAILTADEVAGIAALARANNLWVVSDEVYAGLAAGGRVPSLGAALPEQVLTIGSLSKTHAMTGWRCGWIVGPEDFVRHVDELAQCMLYGLPGFIQDAAIKGLELSEELEAPLRQSYAQRGRRFHDLLQGNRGAIPLLADAGMFALLDIRATGLSGTEFTRQLYAREGVSLLAGEVFGPKAGKGFVRACIAVEDSTLVEAARRIRRFCTPWL